MWEETLLETRNVGSKRNRWIVFASAGFHILVICFLIVFGYWQLEALEPPRHNGKYYVPVNIHSGPPPAPGIRKSTPADRQPVQAIVEPDTKLELTSDDLKPNQDSRTTPGSSDEYGGEPTGDSNGVDGGIGSTPGGGSYSVPGIEPQPGADASTPRVITAEMTPPVLLHRVEPLYPPAALRIRASGMLILNAIINEDGSVDIVDVLKSPHPILERAGIDAVRRWKYRPAFFQNRPVRVFFRVTVHFDIK